MKQSIEITLIALTLVMFSWYLVSSQATATDTLPASTEDVRDVLRCSESLIKAEEGFSATTYRDTKGYSIGYGHNMSTDTDKVITKAEATELLRSRIRGIIRSIEYLPSYMAQDSTRKAVIVSLAYQVGTSGMIRFKRMHQALRDRNYRVASFEALDSLWAKQTPARAQRASEALITGNLKVCGD